MINYNYQNFISLLAKTRHLLVYDDGLLLKNHKDILDSFEGYRYNNLNDTAISHLSNILVSIKVDMALIYAKDYEKVLHLCKEIQKYDKNIVITVIFSNENKLSWEIANIADTVIYEPFEAKNLHKKISLALSAKLMLYEMTHTINTHKKFLDETGIEEFLDAYEEDVTILIVTLSALIERLECGELSHEFFCEIADEIEKVGKIFTYHHYTAHVSMIFDEMAAFLRMYSFDDVELSALEGFDYLTEILKDMRSYLENFFVKRIFSDVYVFEHSLQDSIGFMINRLSNREDTKSELEFF
jgi:cobalamin biosynthesis Co2+ chelatase CbiK